ncbi:Ribosomal protein L3, partial [mine drainage metagenome]
VTIKNSTIKPERRPYNKNMPKIYIGSFKKLELKMRFWNLELFSLLTFFKEGELLDVTSTTKGKGFAGVMKRHHFRGGDATHGSMFHREPGSIGSSAYPSRVLKNKKLPGHMGAKKVTVKT